MKVEAFGQEFDSVRDLLRSKAGIFMGVVGVQASLGLGALAAESEPMLWSSYGAGVAAAAAGVWAAHSSERSAVEVTVGDTPEYPDSL